jgi:hypothetical protein
MPRCRLVELLKEARALCDAVPHTRPATDDPAFLIGFLDAHKLAELLPELGIHCAQRHWIGESARLRAYRDQLQQFLDATLQPLVDGTADDPGSWTMLVGVVAQLSDYIRKLQRSANQASKSKESADMLKPGDVAKELGVSVDTVHGWIGAKQLAAANVATGTRPRWIIQRADLDTFLESRKPKPAGRQAEQRHRRLQTVSKRFKAA